MKRLASVIGIAILFLGIVFSLAFAQETLTISTYYPSPYGSYNELQLLPHPAPLATCDANGKGVMYYDSDEDQIKFCNGSSWIPMGKSVVYGYAVDGTTRSTVSTSFVNEPSLLWQVSVKNGDIILASLEGSGWVSVAGSVSDFDVALVSGSATALTPQIDNHIGTIDRTQFFVERLFRATADGILQFRMVWHATAGGTASVENRLGLARVLGQ